MSIRILGILRAKIFSHRAVDADRLIMEDSLASLESKLNEKGSSFKLVSEEKLSQKDFDEYKPNFVLTMAQGASALALMENFEKKGGHIINSPTSIKNCFRENLVRKMIETNEHHFVQSEILQTTTLDNSSIGHWIKRADFHATDDQDVLFIESGEILNKIKEDFVRRGIDKVIKQPHLDGVVLKFYGVGKKIIDFRNMGYSGHYRYDLPPDPENRQISPELWGKIETSLSPIISNLGLVAYGGDIIISPDQSYHFIDINDWPSFRTCRPVASQLIASESIKSLASCP